MTPSRKLTLSEVPHARCAACQPTFHTARSYGWMVAVAFADAVALLFVLGVLFVFTLVVAP